MSDFTGEIVNPNYLHLLVQNFQPSTYIGFYTLTGVNIDFDCSLFGKQNYKQAKEQKSLLSLHPSSIPHYLISIDAQNCLIFSLWEYREGGFTRVAGRGLGQKWSLSISGSWIKEITCLINKNVKVSR